MNSIQRFATIVLALLGSIPCSLGCSGDGRVAIVGEVTLDGEPLATGTIHFHPVDGATSGAGGGISGGQFQFDRTQGLLPGRYEVTVQAWKETGRTVKDPKFGEAPEMAVVKLADPLPLEVEVNRGGPNTFRFELISKTGRRPSAGHTGNRFPLHPRRASPLIL